LEDKTNVNDIKNLPTISEEENDNILTEEDDSDDNSKDSKDRSRCGYVL